LNDWHQIRDWALKGAAENQIPRQLRGLDSYRAVSTALAVDEHLAVLINEESPQRPTIRVGLFGQQLRASALPAGMIAIEGTSPQIDVATPAARCRGQDGRPFSPLAAHQRQAAADHPTWAAIVRAHARASVCVVSTSRS